MLVTTRKVLSLLLVVITLVLGGCAAAPTNSPTAPATSPAATLSSTPTAAPTTAPTATTAATPTAAATPVPTAAPTSTAAPAATATPLAAATGTAAPAVSYPMTVTDAAGRQVTIAKVPERIVTLAPSDTEIVYALGDGSKVVGVDQFSDYPAEAKALQTIGGSDGQFNYEQIVNLKPDLVLAAGTTSPEAMKKLEDLKLTVVQVGITQSTFDSIFSDINLVGQITGRQDQAQALTSNMRQRVDAIEAKVATTSTRPRVFWELDATDPSKPYTVGPGSFVNDLITMAGGTNIFANTKSPYPQVSSEQVVALNPQVIILSDASYGVTVDSVLKRPGWQSIEAVQKKQVYPIDTNIVSRPGPRIVDGLEAAAKLIHPELFK